MKTFILFGGVVSLFLLAFSLESINGNVLQSAFEGNTFFSPYASNGHDATGDQGIKNDPSLPWRLSPNIQPSRYELVIFPILEDDVPGLGEKWTVPGNVAIHLSPTESATSEIVLHANNIDFFFNETTLHRVLEDGTEVEIAILGQNHNETTMFLTINSSEELVVGTKYILRFKFISQIQEEFHGMYRSHYVNPQNETRWMAITQMEAINARELFPSFDEPGFKAVFSTKIGRKDDHIALTNGPSIRNETLPGIDGWSLESFGDTVPMSTYLFAAVISDYSFSEADPAITPSIVVRTYAPKHQIDRKAGEYSSEQGAFLLKDFETRFGQDYPLSKMDLAAVTDFTFGAMENYGLNIYRAQALLYYPDESTESERGSISQIIAHELAHQYFGNLVSPKWWTHIYLNEGMSTYVQFDALDAVVPEFRSSDLVINQAFQRALAVDADEERSHSLKIVEEEWSTKDPMSWFDTIAYEKGASIARMMEGFLGPQQFSDGLKTYQANNKHQSVVQDDLFEALEEHGSDKLPFDMNLGTVMDSWTNQAGFPILSVSVTGNEIFVSQSKYKQPDSVEKWVIPISVASNSPNPNFGAEPEYWLKDESIKINETSDKWIILNAGLTGYYRIVYEESLEKLIQDQLKSNMAMIHSHSRSQLIDDYFTFAFDGQASVDIERALAFTKYMSTANKPETEMVVWTPFLKHLQVFLNTFGSAGNGSLEDMKAYLLPRIKSAITANGGMDAITLTSKGMPVLFHTQLLDWACAFEDDDCLNYAAASVDAWKANINENPIPHDLKPVLYCAAARKAAEYGEFLIAEYKNLGNGLSPKQRQLLFVALQCISDAELINAMLADTLTENVFHTKSDAAAFLKNLASNYKMRNNLVSFMRGNTTEIMNWFGTNAVNEVLVPVVASLSNFMSSTEDLGQITEYAAENQDLFQGKLNSYLAAIRNNIERIEKFGVPMQQYFKDNYEDDPLVGGSSTSYNVSFLTFAFAIVGRLFVFNNY